MLVGCAARPTLEELEAQAAVTGDWTAVEKRERMNEKMRVQTRPECPEGFILYCRKKSAQEYCECVSPSDRSIFR